MSFFISVNGKISSAQEASISPLDRGFLFAESIFETFVCFQDKILDLNDHLDRLRVSCEKIGIDLPWRDEELVFELKELVSKVDESLNRDHQLKPNIGTKKSIRLMITAGDGLGLYKNPSELKPNKIIYCQEVKKESEDLYLNGLSLKTVTSSNCDREASAKTSNYLQSILAIKKAKQLGFQEVLWLNSEKEFTEAATANIFFIGRVGDSVEILTPSIKSGILEGITRKNILSLLNRAQIPAREEIIPKEELAKFDEAFLCSTVRGLVPINQIDNKKFYTTRKTSVFWNINRLYNAHVKSQLGFGVDWNTGEIL